MWSGAAPNRPVLLPTTNVACMKLALFGYLPTVLGSCSHTQGRVLQSWARPTARSSAQGNKAENQCQRITKIDSVCSALRYWPHWQSAWRRRRLRRGAASTAAREPRSSAYRSWISPALTSRHARCGAGRGRRHRVGLRRRLQLHQQVPARRLDKLGESGLPAEARTGQRQPVSDRQREPRPQHVLRQRHVSLLGRPAYALRLGRAPAGSTSTPTW